MSNYDNLDLRTIYHIEVILSDNTRRVFNNCSYLMQNPNLLHIKAEKGFPVTFVGNFSAVIVRMSDYTQSE